MKALNSQLISIDPWCGSCMCMYQLHAVFDKVLSAVLVYSTSMYMLV